MVKDCALRVKAAGTVFVELNEPESAKLLIIQQRSVNFSQQMVEKELTQNNLKVFT